MKRIADLLGEDAASGEKYQAVIIHANREEEALEWKSELGAIISKRRILHQLLWSSHRNSFGRRSHGAWLDEKIR